MGLVLKYAHQKKDGSWHFRKVVPERLRPFVDKREIKKKLGNSYEEAVKAYPKVFAEAERQLEAARQQAAGIPRIEAKLTPIEHYQQLLARLRAAGFEPVHNDVVEVPGDYDGEIKKKVVGPSIDDWDDRDYLAQGIIDSYPIDPETYDPAMPEAEEEFVRALYGNMPEKPKPTLTDAKKLYLKEKKLEEFEGEPSENRQRRLRVDRVINRAKRVLGGDRPLAEIHRDGARAIRDDYLSETSMKPATVKRYLTDLKAITNLAIREFELNIQNPFAALTVEQEGNPNDARHSMPDAVLEAFRGRLEQKANKQLQTIVALLAYTGCRLNEVVGLRRSAVRVEGEPTPHIVVEFQDNRRIKNRSSIRAVPLVAAALPLTREALKESKGQDYLFPSYAHKRGGDRAGQTLRKHLRAVTEDPKIVLHSLRHRLADKLRLSGATEDEIKLVLGHAGSGITAQYGDPKARLEIAARVLSRAFPEEGKTA